MAGPEYKIHRNRCSFDTVSRPRQEACTSRYACCTGRKLEDCGVIYAAAQSFVSSEGYNQLTYNGKSCALRHKSSLPWGCSDPLSFATEAGVGSADTVFPPIFSEPIEAAIVTRPGPTLYYGIYIEPSILRDFQPEL